VTTIEDRIRAIEDVEAVKTLMAKYHKACDGWDGSSHKNPETIGALFAEDGVWGVSSREPPPTGPAEVAAFAVELQKIPWIMHSVVNPLVEVDGDTARGEFKGIIRVRLDPSSRMVWSMGVYHVEAVRTPDGWRFRSLVWEPTTAAERYDPAKE
jgi:SnoaL-like protein